jgi:hypothetical protein
LEKDEAFSPNKETSEENEETDDQISNNSEDSDQVKCHIRIIIKNNFVLKKKFYYIF